MKRFLDWILIKEKLDSIHWKKIFVSERDFWWIHLGENIGHELVGKGKLFTRPAIVLRKVNSCTFLIAPTTTKAHAGVWYVKIHAAGIDQYVCLHQIRIIDAKRLYRRIGKVHPLQFARIMQSFREVYT